MTTDQVLRQHGIVLEPQLVQEEAHAAGLDLAIACAVLCQESAGGHNEFGHDPTIFVGAGAVTKTSYLAYRKQRDTPSHGARCQGVGPMQLTYWAYQDQADRLGGCWDPRFNLRVGFAILAGNVRRGGLRAGIAAYNGSGPAAQRYADEVLARIADWRRWLADAKPAVHKVPVKPSPAKPVRVDVTVDGKRRLANQKPTNPAVVKRVAGWIKTAKTVVVRRRTP